MIEVAIAGTSRIMTWYYPVKPNGKPDKRHPVSHVVGCAPTREDNLHLNDADWERFGRLYDERQK